MCWSWKRMGAVSAPSRCSPGRSARRAGGGRRSSARERGGGGADEPGVDRQPLAAGGLLDAGLELLGQAEVDARRRGLVGLRRRGRRVVGGRLDRLVAGRRRHDEVGLAGAQAQLDRAGRELARDLVRGGRQRVEQHQPDRRLERRGQPLGERAGVLAAGVGGDGELATEVLDVLGQVHGAIMAPLWCHCKAIMVLPGVGQSGRSSSISSRIGIPACPVAGISGLLRRVTSISSRCTPASTKPWRW